MWIYEFFCFAGLLPIGVLGAGSAKRKIISKGPPQPEMFKNKIYYFTGKYHFGNQNRSKNKGKQRKGVTKRAKKSAAPNGAAKSKTGINISIKAP